MSTPQPWWTPIADAVDRIERSALTLLAANTREEVSDAWDHFLGDASRVFEKSKEISQIHPERADWWQATRDERATEPLLLYLHVARNQDHHGIAPDVIDAEPTVAFTAGRELHFGADGGLSSPDALFPHQVRHMHELKLISVSDPRHSYVPTPQTFRGEWICRTPAWLGCDIYVRDVVKPTLTYFRDFLAEAKAQPN